MAEKIKDAIAAVSDWVIDLRRHFHAFSELSGQKFKTQEKIIAELTALRLESRKVAGTGVLAEITGAKPGRRISTPCR